MNSEEIRLTESFATYVTFIRLLSSVGPHMSDEGRLKRECFTTVLALFFLFLFWGNVSLIPLTIFPVVPSAASFRSGVLKVLVVCMLSHMSGIFRAREFDLAKWTFFIYVALIVCLEMKI